MRATSSGPMQDARFCLSFTLELGDCFKTLDPSPSGAAQLTPNSEGERGQPRERFGGHRNLGLWFPYVRERERRRRMAVDTF